MHACGCGACTLVGSDARAGAQRPRRLASLAARCVQPNGAVAPKDWLRSSTPPSSPPRRTPPPRASSSPRPSCSRVRCVAAAPPRSSGSRARCVLLAAAGKLAVKKGPLPASPLINGFPALKLTTVSSPLSKAAVGANGLKDASRTITANVPPIRCEPQQTRGSAFSQLSGPRAQRHPHPEGWQGCLRRGRRLQRCRGVHRARCGPRDLRPSGQQRHHRRQRRRHAQDAEVGASCSAGLRGGVCRCPS
jgi:hypothetical protein